MDYKELKERCLKKVKNYPNLKERLRKELYRAKIAYNNGIDLVEDLILHKKEIKNGVIPFLLELINIFDASQPMELKQVSSGGGGGLDIDIDYANAGKPLIKEYLENKYGKEAIISVGTYSEIGLLSGLKDILRKEKIDFQKSNEFCKCFDSELSWEQNIENLKSNKQMYNIYLEHKDSIDMCPKIMKKFRQVGMHAGGVCPLPGPVYNYIPVMRVANTGTLVSAFTESGQNAELDEAIGIQKIDVLAIINLDISKSTIEMINEKLYEIEEDGIRKIVPESYLTP